MQIQELSYLRNELNQRISFFYEHSHKVKVHTWVIWGVLLAIWSTNLDLLGINTKGIIVAFVAICVLFISNMFLYIASLKDQENLWQICTLSAYLTIFYEWKIGKNRRCYHNSWEIANLELLNENKAKLRHLHLLNDYAIMAFVSTLLILALSFYIIYNFCVQIQGASIQIPDSTDVYISLSVVNRLMICISLFVIFCLAVFIISIFLVRWIYQNTTVKGLLKEKEAKVRFFLDYAIENKYYSKAYVLKRFGKEFLDAICYTLPSQGKD